MNTGMRGTGLSLTPYTTLGRHPLPNSRAGSIEAIKCPMEEHELNTTDLGKIIGYKSRASEILNRKRKLTLPMMRKISKTLNIPVEMLVKEYELAK